MGEGEGGGIHNLRRCLKPPQYYLRLLNQFPLISNPPPLCVLN